MLASRLAALLVAAASLGAAVAVAQPGTRNADGPALETRAAGRAQVANSRAGQAVLGKDGWQPGESVTGSVTVANEGDAEGYTTLEATDLTETPGIFGGHLSSRMVLDVVEGSGRAVYRGTLAGMPAIAVGTFAPGAQRTYRFTATLPDGGPGGADNAWQGARVAVGFRWTMVGGSEAAPVAPVAPSPVPPPAAEAAPEPGPVRLQAASGGVRKGRLRVGVSCDRPCQARLTGQVMRGRTTWRIRPQRRALPAGFTSVQVKLPRASLRRGRIAIVWVAAEGERVRLRTSVRARPAVGLTGWTTLALSVSARPG
jgi:hypothetical protein